MSRLSPARAHALACLLRAEREGRFVREVAESMPRKPEDPRDAALALRLALGATAAAGTLDELLDRYVAKPRAVKLPVRLALRIAAFELLYLKVPARVAVSQGVELVRAQAKSAAGMANAVLRRVADACASFLAAEDIPAGVLRDHTAVARCAGLPVWLAEAIVSSLRDERAQALFDAQLEPAPVYVHLNPRFSFEGEDAPAGQNLTDASGADAAALMLPGLLQPADASSFIRSGALNRADAVASDAAAQLIATAVTAPGSCLEIGAGRGTKTFIMCAQSHRLGWERAHVALDLSARKCELNLERLRAAGLADGVRCVAGDGCEVDAVLLDVDAAAGQRVLFDRVFVDAPCSGTGTMRRHPEIPWRLAPTDVEHEGALPHLQLALLHAAASRVAEGGELIYATCSVLASENQAVVDAFLASSEGAAFSLAPVHEAQAFSALADSCGSDGPAVMFATSHEDSRGYFQTVPAPDACDGHFCARMVRRSASCSPTRGL